MNLSNERILAARAKELGESADAGAFEELAGLVPFPVPNIRELSGVPPHSTKLPDFGAGGGEKMKPPL